MDETTRPTEPPTSAFTWEAARAKLVEARERALKLGGPETIARQRAGGRWTIRERIDHITDPRSFLEVGTVAVHERFDPDGNRLPHTASGYVMGLGQVNGRDVAVGGEDFTVEGGVLEIHHDRLKGGMAGFVEDLAHEYRIPLVMLMEGVGGGVGWEAHAGSPPLVSGINIDPAYKLMGEVPVMAAAMGACAGVTGARLVVSHFSVMTKAACIFAGGPPLVERALGHRIDKFELGGAEVHAVISGVVDNIAEDDADAIRQIKTVLSYLPQNVWEMPPYVPSDDPPGRQDEVLLEIMPEDPKAAYDVRDIIEVIADRGSFFEIGGHRAPAFVCGFARFGGYPVGILANNPMHLGGALDGPGSEKKTRFIEFCDTFHMPMIYFVDIPGFMIGLDAERDGTLRKGMRALQALLEANVPMVTVYLHKCYGMAGLATGNASRLNLRLAWPTAEFGGIPIEGGVFSAHRHQIQASDDPSALIAEVEARMRLASSPWKTAEAFGVEEMIDPTETRGMIVKFLKAAQGVIKHNLGPNPRYGARL